MAGFDNDVVYANNADFSVAGAGSGSAANGLQLDGQLWTGSTAANVGGTHVNVGNITSPLGTVAIGYASPNITLDLAGGGAAIERVALQTGTTPIVPAAGTITFNGAVVAAGTNPVRTDGTGASTVALEIQRSQAIAASDATKIGLSNFQSAQFSVDANGFVALVGGAAPAANSFPTDTGTSVPSATGVLNVKGQTTPSTSGIRSVTATNEVDIQMFSPYTLGDFSFDTSTASTTRSLQVQNTDNTSGTSSARQNILVGGTAAGDPWTQYTIGTARSWAVGVDNSDADTLKFRTDSDATVDPSSGTFCGAVTTTGGWEMGSNASGTTSATIFVSAQRNQNDSSILQVVNATAGTNALGEVRVQSDSCTLSVLAISSSYTVDPTVADYVQLHALGAAGLDFQSDGGTFRFFGTSSVNRFATCTAAGEWTYPLQPAFLAYNSTNRTGQTKGAFVTVQFDTEVFDQGADFASNTFTAPVTGRYQLSASVDLSGINAATRAEIYITTSNRLYKLASWNPTATITTGAITTGFSGSVLADMDAADTAIVQVVVDGGTLTYTIQGSVASSPVTLTTMFSGNLEC